MTPPDDLAAAFFQNVHPSPSWTFPDNQQPDGLPSAADLNRLLDLLTDHEPAPNAIALPTPAYLRRKPRKKKLGNYDPDDEEGRRADNMLLIFVLFIFFLVVVFCVATYPLWIEQLG